MAVGFGLGFGAGLGADGLICGAEALSHRLRPAIEVAPPTPTSTHVRHTPAASDQRSNCSKASA